MVYIFTAAETGCSERFSWQGVMPPEPTAVFLHGLPGNEKNCDLAHALRDDGWNSLIFHYRGCWRSEGVYAFKTIIADVHAAIDELCCGHHPQVDPDRLILIGLLESPKTTIWAILNIIISGIYKPQVDRFRVFRRS